MICDYILYNDLSLNMTLLLVQMFTCDITPHVHMWHHSTCSHVTSLHMFTCDITPRDIVISPGVHMWHHVNPGVQVYLAHTHTHTLIPTLVRAYIYTHTHTHTRTPTQTYRHWLTCTTLTHSLHIYTNRLTYRHSLTPSAILEACWKDVVTIVKKFDSRILNWSHGL